MIRLLLLFSFFFCSLFGVEKKYEPWNTGPLIASSGNVLDVNTQLLQPICTAFDFYGRYDKNFKLRKMPSIFNFSSNILWQVGVFKHFDITSYANFSYQHSRHKAAWTWGDSKERLSFQLYKANEDSSCPSIRLFVAENFPTGKYRNLNPQKKFMDANGIGAYTTQFGIALSNTSYFLPNHPFTYYFNFFYTLPARASLKGFNAYGGGYGTDGSIKVGASWYFDFAFELNFTQKWAICSDFFLNCYHSSKDFKGNPGRNADGTEAINYLPDYLSFSITPGIEYNFSANFGIFFGSWISLFGKNSYAFFSGYLSAVYIF